jgi:hypothetical protein
VRKPTGRGPSRPIDPRRAPGPVRRTGPDPFAIGLIVVSGVVVLGVILLALMQNRGAANNTTNPQSQAGPTVPPDLTATAIAFATQTRPEVLPHVSVTEAKTLYDANDARFIDVRVPEQYAAGHIQGAANIPYTDVGERVAEIPRTGNVIVYCQ